MLQLQKALLLGILALLAAAGGANGGEIHEQCQTADGMDEACIFERLDSEDALKDAFGAAPVQYRVQASFLKSLLPPLERDVTLVTQGSMERLLRLREQALQWHGTLSVAIYLRPHEQASPEYDEVLVTIHELHAGIESLGKCRLIISLVYGLDPATTPIEFDTLYPINALRNIALLQATTPLVMVIDIDFVPSRHFWQYLTDNSRYAALITSAHESLHVWALVSLELHEGYLPLPETQEEVARGLTNASVVVAEAYLNPAAHMPVGIQEWLLKNEIYGPIEASEAFEPFVLGSREKLPLYDERFRGYGWDKTTHAAQLRKEGFSYYMLPYHFVVARYHQPTPTAVRMFGDGEEQGDTLLRMRME